MNQTFRIAALVLASLAAVSAFAANPPVVLSIDPQNVVAGMAAFTLTVNGAANTFVSGATVRVNGSSRNTSFVSASQLTATITASDIFNAGTLQITATNPGTLPSSALALTVLPNSPTISSIDPASVSTQTAPLTLTVNGQNFASTATVMVGANSRTTTFVNTGQLTAALPASDLAFSATLQITVLNPNNKTSNAVPLTVTSTTPSPAITVISPSTVTAGGNAFTLSVVGTTFANGAVVKANGLNRATTFVDTSHLTAQILSTDIVKAGTINITVANPDGSTSASAKLTVAATTQPVILSLSPSTITAGAAQFTLTINGSGFVNGSTAQVNGSSRSATFISASSLTVTVMTSDVISPGQLPITVTTPPPNGSVSNQFSLNVVSQFAPTITSITPSTLLAGSLNLKLLINGSNFQTDDIAQAGGSARVTEYVSATQLAITLLAGDVAQPGTVAITVARKNGSGTSAPLTLTVTAADALAISGFNPPSAAVGQAPFTLSVLGNNFATTSVLVVDNATRSTTYISPTTLQTDLTTSDLASQRDLPVQVVNPGGVISPTVLFSVTTLQLSITSLTPSQVISGAPSFQLSVAGTNFSDQSAIKINGTALTTQLHADGTLSATVDSSLIAAPGTLSVTVTSNGGASSAPASLIVLRPAITSVDPSIIVAGSSSAALTIHGSAFLASSVVLFKGTQHQAVLNSDGTLTTLLTGTDLGDAGQYGVVVKNSASSTSIPFMMELVAPGTPVITSLTPNSLEVGTSQTGIQVAGGNFVPASVVQVNGSDRVTNFLTNVLLSATLLPADLKAPGNLTITVKNPDGAISLPATLTVTGGSFSPPRRRAVPH
jgi:hypothetical protein